MLSHSLSLFCLAAWHGAGKPTPYLPEQPTALEQHPLYRSRAADKAWMDPPTRIKTLGPDVSVVLILDSLEQDQGFPAGLEFGPLCHNPIKHNCLLVKQCQAHLSQMPVYWLLRGKEKKKKALRCYCLGLQDAGHINYEQMKWSQNRDEPCNLVWLQLVVYGKKWQHRALWT